jgi:coenzyme F420-0:L-glutamate ligase/coenzyme F420-1:gamma-L-glutamate ligase
VSTGPALEIIGVEGIPEVVPGDDLVAILAPRLLAAAARDDDVVVITSKIVSKAEGRLVPGDDRGAAVEAETERVVARRGDLVIAETRHGFVCANAGVDASNLDTGTLALLPLDPDATAERIRHGLRETLGARLGVVITDTFGRAWRTGVVNVAIGCAGVPATVDLRGRPDDRGRPLEATVVALADEIAAASGLVMGKDARVPVALVRGVSRLDGVDGSAADLIRPADEDLFRTSTHEAIRSLSSGASTHGSGPIGRELLIEAIGACATPWPPGGPGHGCTVIEDPDEVAAMLREAAPAEADASILIVPWLEAPGDQAREPWWGFAAGGYVTALATALAGAGVTVRWFDRGGTPSLLRAEDGRVPLGVLACGAVK